MTTITDSVAEALIIGASIIAIIFGLLNAFLILRIKVISEDDGVMALKENKLAQKY